MDYKGESFAEQSTNQLTNKLTTVISIYCWYTLLVQAPMKLFTGITGTFVEKQLVDNMPSKVVNSQPCLHR